MKVEGFYRSIAAALVALVILASAAITSCSTDGSASKRAVKTGVSPTADSPSPLASPGVAALVIYNANVVTMDDNNASAQGVAVGPAGRIMKVGTNAQVLGLADKNTQQVDLRGATVLPGFIDPHSHMAGYAMYNDPDHWTDVSNINVLFKPLPGTPGCLDAKDYQHCFVPVQTQQDVTARIKAAVAKIRQSGSQIDPLPVLAFNYDASRLGHGAGCSKPDGLGLDCETFENGLARPQLDAIAQDIPIYVTSESGHISYVNTRALQMLNICNTSVASGACHAPTTNPTVESQLAEKGQLDEDLSLYATGKMQGLVLNRYPTLAETLLQKAATIYAQHGYTLAQEGAATIDDIGLYNKVLQNCLPTKCPFPLSAAMVAYDDSSPDFSSIVATGVAGRTLVGSNPLLTVAMLKSFTDGSPQGYTAFLNSPYMQVFTPFTNGGIFQQPYVGLPDLSEQQIQQRLYAAHAAGFPMLIHQIGDAAIGNAVRAVMASATKDHSVPPPGTHDVMLHAPMITTAQLDQLKTLNPGVVVSIMSTNVYYYGLPECQQVLGPQRTMNIYPARAVRDRGLHLTLHSDTPVTPPYPLFEIWVGVTRQTQQPSWYPNRNTQTCPVIFANNPAYPGDERISILDGIKAFTTNAAWQYGMTDRGSLATSNVADMVILSSNPLDPSVVANPNLLQNIRTLATVSYGRYIPNPTANQPPVWPN
jgi:predicted amidohydrolase YtcJ